LDRGQLTNQAGATVSYRALQQGIRNYYRTYIALPAEARDRPALTPGEGWLCQLCQQIALIERTERFDGQTRFLLSCGYQFSQF